MKNSEILLLANAGVLSVTAHNISAAHAYKVLKFRKVVDAAFNAILERRKEIAKECGIEEDKQYEDNDPKIIKCNKMFEALADDDTPLEGIKTMPYEVWRELQRENKEKEISGRKFDILSGKVELLLEDVLWVAPVENDEETQDNREKTPHEKVVS